MNKKINKVIDASIDSINKDLSIKLNNSDDTEIIGGSSQLDSLGVLSFVMELEKNIEDIYGVEIALVNDDFLSGDSPFEKYQGIENSFRENFIIII